MSPVIPSGVLLRLVTLFINAMIWVSQFFKSPPEPINHHVSPVFPPLSYSLAFGHSDSKWGSESLSLMPWFELHNLSIVVRSFTTMIFTLYLTVVSFHHPLSAETKGALSMYRSDDMAIWQYFRKIWKYWIYFENIWKPRQIYPQSISCQGLATLQILAMLASRRYGEGQLYAFWLLHFL